MKKNMTSKIRRDENTVLIGAPSSIAEARLDELVSAQARPVAPDAPAFAVKVNSVSNACNLLADYHILKHVDMTMLVSHDVAIMICNSAIADQIKTLLLANGAMTRVE